MHDDRLGVRVGGPAVLSGADLRGANVTGVDLAALRLDGATLDVAQAVQVARGLGAVVE